VTWRRATVDLGTALLPPRGRVVDVGCGADIATFLSTCGRDGIDVSPAGWGSESTDLILPWDPVNRAMARVFAGEARGR
jgi:hypothetical protein